jgi:hypothetical protein
MGLSFGAGDSSFTIDGLVISGGDITGTANHITVKNSAFTSPLDITITGSNSAILLDHDTFNNQSTSDCQGVPARVWIENSSSPTDVTVSNSVLSGGNLDGIRPDGSGGATIISNEFYNIEENGPNDCQHTDSIQMYGGQNVVIRGNYFHANSDGIVAFDGTQNNQITNNACANISRGACVTLYSDQNSVVEHNTAGAGMDALEIDHKSGDPAGTGTVFRNNVGGLSVGNGSTVTNNTNNLYSGASSPNIGGNPIFAGGSSPTTWAGFKLTSGSPGISAATDGTNVGIN